MGKEVMDPKGMEQHSQEASHGGEPQAFDREISLRAITYTMVSVILVTLLSMVAMWGMGKAMKRHQIALDRPLTPVEIQHRAAVAAAGPNREPSDLESWPEQALPSTAQLPPGPVLQSSPERVLKEMRSQEERTLHSYAWVDRGFGEVRIPIERAMDLLAERGMPYRSMGGAEEPLGDPELPSSSVLSAPPNHAEPAAAQGSGEADDGAGAHR